MGGLISASDWFAPAASFEIIRSGAGADSTVSSELPSRGRGDARSGRSREHPDYENLFASFLLLNVMVAFSGVCLQEGGNAKKCFRICVRDHPVLRITRARGIDNRELAGR